MSGGSAVGMHTSGHQMWSHPLYLPSTHTHSAPPPPTGSLFIALPSPILRLLGEECADLQPGVSSSPPLPVTGDIQPLDCAECCGTCFNRWLGLVCVITVEWGLEEQQGCTATGLVSSSASEGSRKDTSGATPVTSGKVGGCFLGVVAVLGWEECWTLVKKLLCYQCCYCAW